MHPVQEALFRTKNWKTDEFTVQSEGHFWLVHSEDIKIQGSYKHNESDPDLTSLNALAIGGPFLGDNVLLIETFEGKVMWNDQSIVSAINSTFSNKYMSAHYHKESELVASGKTGMGIDIKLPHGVSLVVNRWDKSLAAKIQMCNRMIDQDGQCGNNNHDHTDDYQASDMLAQRVLSGEHKRVSLFTTGRTEAKK